MGSGDRFKAWIISGLMFGMTVERFPFDWTVTFVVGPFALSYGFGKAYDEVEEDNE